jgi:hypothetical protein
MTPDNCRSSSRSRRTFCAFAALCMILSWVAVGRAEITAWQCDPGASDTTGVQVDWNRESEDAYQLHIRRSQSTSTGPTLLDFATDTPDDPKITSINEVGNDTDATWVGYHLVVTLNTPVPLTSYSLGQLTISNPTDWTAAITQPMTAVGQNTAGQYEYVGQIDLTGGTPVGAGGELDFRYALVFAGSTMYHAVQEQSPVFAANPGTNPVPEPSTFVLASLGALGLLGCLGRRRR